MAYNILSIGDAEMMYNAFNGVAMVFTSNNMTTLMKIGFMIGLFMIAFQYLFEMRFPLHSILVAYIVTAGLFFPKDTVVIEDIYTGQIYTVANVPLGVAMPMSIVSSIGVSVTQLYETVFSTPDEAHLLEAGYLQPLSTLIKLRNIGLGTASSDLTLNGSLSYSLNEYIAGCVMYDIELQIPMSEHEVTQEKLMKADDLWVAMKTTFINKDVLVDLPTLTGQQSCKDAYNTLDAYLNSADFNSLWEHYLRGVLNIQDANVAPEEVITQSTQALGMTAISAQTFMRNALMAAYLRDGPIAFIQRTGIEQLRLQWSGEQGIFQQISRPLTAFVEILTVAISPIMAFLTTLGLLGFKMIARYFQMLIWIALWGPITAVCNLYIAMVTTRVMTTLSIQAEANGTSLMAMVVHDQFFSTLENWLATGGMLASSVPAIALMLVYGGSVAATNLSSRMTSAASAAVKPERLMPEPIALGPATSVGSQRTMDANTGQTVSGWSESLYNLANSSQRAKQSAWSSLQTATSTAAQSFNQLTQQSTSTGSNTTSGSSITRLLSQSNSASDRWAAGTGKALADKIGRTEQERAAIAASASTQLALGANTGTYIPLRLDGNLNQSSDTAISADRSKEISEQMNKTFNDEHATSNETRSAYDYAKSQTHQSVFSSQDMKMAGENYIAQLARVEQAQTAYQQSLTDSQTFGQNLNLKHSELAQRLVQSGAYVELSNIERDIAIKGSTKDQAEWQLAKTDAAKQINNGAAKIAKTSLEYEALQRFLALDDIDSSKALHLIASTFKPTDSQSITSLSNADDYQQEAKKPDALVSQHQADAFNNQAKSKDIQIAPTSGFDLSLPAAAGFNVHHTQQTVTNALQGHALDENAITNRINIRPLISPEQDTSQVMGQTIKNQGKALYDNTVAAGSQALDNAAHKGTEVVGHLINGATNKVIEAENYLRELVTSHDKPMQKPDISQTRKANDELPDIKNDEP